MLCHFVEIGTLVWESPLVQQAANQVRCHSEPVRLSGVGISARTAGRILKTVSFRTSPQTGVGISPVIETAFS